DGLRQAGIEPDPDLVVEGEFSFESGIAGARQLLDMDDPPTAIFAANDDTACGVLYEAAARGLAVPAQLSVFGFDDTPISRQVWPSLTTVRQTSREMGRIAAQKLITAIDGHGPAHMVRVPYQLQILHSTGPAPGRRGHPAQARPWLVQENDEPPGDRGFVLPATRGWPADWSGKRDSNSRPQPWQGCALPTELFPHEFFLRRYRWRPGSELNRRTRICSPLHNHSATRPVTGTASGKPPERPSKQNPGSGALSRRRRTPAGVRHDHRSGAGNETRTRDLNLGKVALYQLSYSRLGD